jgi:8-oxo-dGTP pyrophosphatase MutT (NUDIX family)
MNTIIYNTANSNNTQNTNNKSFMNNFCNNCGKIGHVFQTCKHPITSVGIIIFRKHENKIQYLLIRRKHSLGFVEFMRGKYPLHNYNYLVNVFNEMSIDEKELIKRSTFDELWSYLWGDHMGIQYRGEEKVSREKFETLKCGIESNKQEYNLEKIITNSTVIWDETEWGFPKGRRNYQEKDLVCALREFEEETGYLRSNVILIQNIIPYEEIFTGSNMKSYKHKYFLGCMESNILTTNEFQKSEVSEIKWMSYEESMAKIRPYNLEKKNILSKINTMFQTYKLY